jgi:hypothetical protein
MHELARKSIAAPPVPPPPDGPAVSPPVIDPDRWEDFPVFREIFLVMFTDARANDAMRRFGLLQYEMAIETWGQWPDHREGIFPAELRAAVADMRHMQGALSSWCGPGFSNTSEYEIRLAGVGAHVAQGIAKLADRLEVELDSWQEGPAS